METQIKTELLQVQCTDWVKASYSSPLLIRYGGVAVLTRSAGSCMKNDGNGNSCAVGTGGTMTYS